MTRTNEMAEQLMGSIVSRLGPEVKEKIFDGKNPPKNAVKRAEWVRIAISKLDESVDEATREEIMHGNGTNCANHNMGVVKASLARRSKHRTLEAFIDSEIRKPPEGTSLDLNEEALVLSYLPRQFRHPMRCFCGLVNSLPDDEIISPTYCRCSVGFVETWWSQIIGKPVNVQLIESAVTGSDKCRFRITW